VQLPTFMVIGGQKTGTKWLYHNLSHHPDIYVADGGGCYEVHYLNSLHYGDVHWWGTHYVAAKKGETIFGDITPDYAVVDSRRVAHAHRLCPEAKIIYTLRNPKQRAVSHLRMIHSKTLKDYAGEPRGPMLKMDSDLGRLVDFFEHGPGRDHGDYLTNIERWLEFYPRDQVLVLSYDLLRRNPERYLQRILEFLGARPIPMEGFPIRQRFHKSEPHAVPQDLLPHLDRIFDPTIRDLSEWVDFDISGWLQAVDA